MIVKGGERMHISNDLNALFEKVKEQAAVTSGIITTKQIEEAGIYRGMIRHFVKEGLLVKESKGIYSLADEYPDEYLLLQIRSKKMIFSYGTALYLWELSDRVPHMVDVSVPQGFNGSRILKDNNKLRFHYVQKDKWDIGIAETRTPLGNTVKLYDMERCICDLIMSKKEVEKQLYVQAVKEYFNDNCNTRKILKYAKAFHIEEKVRDYMEVLT